MSEARPGHLRLDRMWVLMMTAFVDMVGYALILPLLPLYALDFDAAPSVIGLILGAFAFAQLVTAPLWGRLSDRIGRRPVILLGQVLACGAFLLFALVNLVPPGYAIGLLFLCRLVQGAGGGTISVNQAYASDVAEPEERAKALGWITASSSLGVMLGPAIGSFSVRFSEAAPGLIAAAMAAVNVVFIWRCLPESSRRLADRPKPRPILPAIRAVVTHPGETTSTLIGIYAVAMMAFMAMNAIMAIFLAERFGITKENIGWFYVVVGGVSVVMRALILGAAVRHFGEVRVLRVGAALLALGMLLAPLAGSATTFLLAILLVPTGTALLFPSTTSLVSRYADPGEVGKTLGVQQSFGGISRLLGPVCAGIAFQQLGPRWTFWAAAFLVAIAGLVALRLTPRGPLTMDAEAVPSGRS